MKTYVGDSAQVRGAVRTLKFIFVDDKKDFEGAF